MQGLPGWVGGQVEGDLTCAPLASVTKTLVGGGFWAVGSITPARGLVGLAASPGHRPYRPCWPGPLSPLPVAATWARIMWAMWASVPRFSQVRSIPGLWPLAGAQVHGCSACALLREGAAAAARAGGRRGPPA